MLKEIITTKKNEISINVVQGMIESIRKKNISKTGLRVLKDGFIGVAGALGKYDEETLSSQAKEALINKVNYDVNLTEGKNCSYTLEDNIPKGEAFIKETQEVLSILREKYPDFIFSNKISLTSLDVELKNDLETQLKYMGTIFANTLIFKEKTSSNIMDGYIAHYGNKYDRATLLQYIDDIYHGYKNLKSDFEAGSYPVIFAGSNAFGKFASDLNGQTLSSGSSLFSGKIGEKLFNENFTLYQTTDPAVTFSPFFDTEGTVNENYTYNFIENGVLKAAYSDKRTSKEFGIPHSGSAVGEYDSVPSIGLSSIVATKTHNSLNEITDKECIWVYISSGGDFTPDGNYGAPVQLAFLVKNNKIIARLPEMKLSSNVFDMFGKDFMGVCPNSIDSNSIENFTVIRMDVEKA